MKHIDATIKQTDDDGDGDVPLGPAGAARRQMILADALRSADRRRRRRFAARAGVAACVVGAIASAFALLTQPKHPATIVVESPPPAPTTSPSDLQRSVATPPKVVVQIIRPGDVKPRWEVLSDDQFLAAMADAGRPSGVVTINGKSVLVPVQISLPLPRTRGRGSG